MKFTRVPVNTFQKLQLNAGIFASEFDTKTGEVKEENLLGATNGGANFTATPTFGDRGDGIDNIPVNVKEMKDLETWEATISGTFVTADTALAKRLIGAADIDPEDPTHIIPRNTLSLDDFSDIWWIGDYSDVNSDGDSDSNAGYMAIRLINALSTGGFQVQSANRDKGQFAFTFTAHYSLDDQNRVPFDVYIKDGNAAASALNASAPVRVNAVNKENKSE